jgi:hypothetical protein
MVTLRRIFQFNVTVIASKISIVPGDRVIHIGVGQQLRLSCLVQTGPIGPSYILWFRNNRIIEYDETIDAAVTIEAESDDMVYKSNLTLNHVSCRRPVF